MTTLLHLLAVVAAVTLVALEVAWWRHDRDGPP